jgi:hypothetical protein
MKKKKKKQRKKKTTKKLTNEETVALTERRMPSCMWHIFVCVEKIFVWFHIDRLILCVWFYLQTKIKLTI